MYSVKLYKTLYKRFDSAVRKQQHCCLIDDMKLNCHHLLFDHTLFLTFDVCIRKQKKMYSLVEKR